MRPTRSAIARGLLRAALPWTAYGWMALGVLPSAHAGAATPNVVTTIFPLYDWVRAVGGTNVHVHQLLPPGVEAHTYAPSPSDLSRIERADLFVYVSRTMEPWAERLAHGRCRLWAAIRAVNPTTWPARVHSPPSTTFQGTRGRSEAAADPCGATTSAACPHTHAHGDAELEDPHIWLDPLIAVDIVHGLSRALGEVAPEHREYYCARAKEYAQQLLALHEEFAAFFQSLDSRAILYAGHRAFDLFGTRYGVEFISPYRGFSPEVPPSPSAVAALIERMRTTSSRVIFTEEIVEPRIARVIAEQTGARIERLHSLHNRTPEEARRDETYLSLHRRNLAILKASLTVPTSPAP